MGIMDFTDKAISCIDYAKNQYKESNGEINWADVRNINEFDDMVNILYKIRYNNSLMDRMV